MRDLATTLVDARRAVGLNQAQLARRAGISASYLSRIESAAWERGGPWPADAVLRALARALGLSSTELLSLRQAARERHGVSAPGAPARPGSRSPYAVSVGADAADAAARGVVTRNPADGAMRSAQVFSVVGVNGPTYLDELGSAMAARPEGILYRVCSAERHGLGRARATVDTLAGGRPPERATNVRTRFTFSNPLVLDVLIGDNEAFLAVPDRRGHPHLRAAIVVDDPDFVAALRAWFDESVWEPPAGYADLRGRPVDDAFVAIEECLSEAGQPLLSEIAEAP